MTSLPDIITTTPTPLITEQKISPPAPANKSGTGAAAMLYAMDVPGTTVGLELAPRLGPEGKVETSRKIPSGVHGKVVQALTGQLQNLLSIQQQDRAFFDTVFLNDPAHQNEANLLKLVTNKEGAIDRQKISELLELRADDNTYPGLQMALTALDTFSSRLGMAMGAAAVTRHESTLWQDHTPSKEVKLVAQKRSDNLNLDVGGARIFTERHRKKGILGIGTIAGAKIGSLVATGTGYLTSTLGALVGGAVAPAIGLGIEAYSRSGKGWHIDQEAFRLGLEEMQKPANAVEREIMIRAYGIDPTDFTTNANGEIIQNPGKQSSEYRTGNIQELQDAYLALATTRIEVMTALGNPLKGTFASPEENFLLFQDKPKNAMLYREKNSVAYARQIDERWQRLIRRERDAGRNPTTTDELLSLKLEARRQVFGEYLNQVEEILDKPKEEQRRGENVRVLGGLKEKYQYKKGDLNNPEVRGERIKQRTKTESERREMHDGVKTKLELAQKDNTDYISKSLTLQALYREVQESYGIKFDRRNDTPEDRLSRIEAEIKLRDRDTVEQLTTLKNEIVSAQQVLNAQEETGRRIDVLFNEVESTYGQFVLPISSGGLGLNDSVLAHADISAIFRYINQINLSDRQNGTQPPRGWDARENGSNLHRQTLLYARAEAQARVANPDIGSFSELNLIRQHTGISLNRLRAMESDELRQFVKSMPSGPNKTALRQLKDADYSNVLSQARIGYEARSRAMLLTVKEEKAWREGENTKNTQQKELLTNQATVCVQSLDGIIQQQGELDKISSPKTIARALLKENWAAYQHKGLQGLQSLHNLVSQNNALNTRTDCDISYDAVKKLSFAQVLSRINTIAKEAQLPGAWEQGSNGDEDRIFSVICYMAEARAQDNTYVRSDNQSLTGILKTTGYSERDLMEKSPQDVLNQLISKTRRGTNQRTWSDSDKIEIQNAIQLALEKYNVRSQTLEAVLTESIDKGIDIDNQIRSGTQLASHIQQATHALDAQRIFRQNVNSLQTKYKQEETKLNLLFSKPELITALGGNRVTSTDELQQIVNRLSYELQTLVKFGDSIDPANELIKTDLDTYGEALAALQKSQLRASQKLELPAGRYVSVRALSEQISFYEKHPVQGLKDIKAQIETNEASQRFDSEDRKKIANTFETGKRAMYALTESVNDTLIRAGYSGLPIDDIDSLSIEDINRCVNRANELDKSIGWPREENKNHIHELYLAKIEARNRLYDQDFTAGGNWLFDNIERNGEEWQMTEVDLLTVSQDELLDRIHEAARRGVPGAWAAGDPNEVHWSTDLRNARQEAQRRFERRIRSSELHRAIEEVTQTIKDIQLDEEAIIQDMREDIEYVELVHTMASRQGEIYSWIKEWAGTGGKARETTSFQTIDVGDDRIPLYIRQDRSQDPPVDRLIPQGLIDVYQALFNFEGAGDIEKQEEMFQKIISHPDFNPDAIAAVLNHELDLRLGTIPGATLDLNCANVFYAIQQRIHNNDLPGLNYQDQPAVNRRTLHKAIRQIIQDDIARAKVM